MKNIFWATFHFSLILYSVLSVSCRKSAEDEFNDANLNSKAKFLTRLEVVSTRYEENLVIDISYDSNNRVTSFAVNSAENGLSYYSLYYDSNNSLNGAIRDGDFLDVDDLYQSPLNVFETGTVLEYDEKGNPSRIEINKYNYDLIYGGVFDSFDYLTGEITYENAPNPFFHTLNAAKFIDVLDMVNLNLGFQASPSIVKARQLLPLNNIKKMNFWNPEEDFHVEVNANYDYDTDNYPKEAIIITKYTDYTESNIPVLGSTRQITYTYKQ
ncbi:hypothetical protein C7N43_03385 [Sphingobacteriales bacterium UPWRP_1]|nr:hypothetical protein BVG80_08785 [Sphingobacteriales bacterium TSM_CSM]PSJ78521.1 hypothetical protein C7N43_03385 [Sphingobacteriales bacterium UPWRP_1]